MDLHEKRLTAINLESKCSSIGIDGKSIVRRLISRAAEPGPSNQIRRLFKSRNSQFHFADFSPPIKIVLEHVM